MKPCLLLITLLSVHAAAQTAAQVCGRIPYADQKVSCIRTISGHDVEPGAARVCGRILYGEQVVRCLAATLDKHYQPDELAACDTILAGEQKASCMAAGGVSLQVRNADRVEPRTDERPEPPAQPQFDSTVTFENRTSRLVGVRYYWRWAGRGEWTEFGDRKRLGPGAVVSLQSTSGLFDYCVELTDGRSAFWARTRLDRDEQRLWFTWDGVQNELCIDRR